MLKNHFETNKAKRETEIVHAPVSLSIKNASTRVAASMRISISEYPRKLVLDDLDNRIFVTTQLKRK